MLIKKFINLNMLSVVLFISSSFLNGQCVESEVELWGNCYSIESTFELNLSEQGIAGIIPEQISILQNLLFLDLSDNDLEGSLPSQLFDLENLLGLNLSGNELDGEI